MAPLAVSATERSPHELYDAINALTLDSSQVYHLVPENRIELHRGDAVLSLDEGALAFFSPFDGRVTGAVFSGRGHVLAVPREPVEKQQMGRFLGSPVLDETFASAYFRFTDETANELLSQFHKAKLSPQADTSFVSQWQPTLARFNPMYTLRTLVDYLSPDPRPAFYANLDGASTGPLDVVVDGLRDEQFLLGQTAKNASGTFYDIWTSHRVPNLPERTVAFRALHYSLESSILANNSLDATATIQARAETGKARILVFELSRVLTVDRVTAEHGEPLEFFQNEGLTLHERSARGNDYLYVVLSGVPSQNQEFALRFHYHGNVIEDAGNGVLFVGARESWYPHLGDPSEFALYELTIRWPRKLRIVATGSKLDEHEEGDFRIGHWKTEKPTAVAGFNLGEYATSSVTSGGHSIDVYANRELEANLRNRLQAPSGDGIPITSHTAGAPSTRLALTLPGPTPSPADALKQLAKEIDASVHFYETLSGPFPFHNLSVSQIPGTFGQGWPGLLYVSTFSFLSPEAQQRAGLSPSGQEHFTELVPYHEVAHQWWGNVVGWSSYRDQWIDEAISNYLALLFADSRGNPEHALRVWLSRYRRQLTEKSPDADEPAADIGALTLGLRLNSSKSPSAYERVVYSKGSWIIHMLREMLRQPGAKQPDARFTSLLQTLATKYAYRALSTQDLQHEVESVMTPAMDLENSRSMDWFFDEWVRGTGIPRYRVEFTVHHDEAGYSVRGRLFQSNVPRSFLASVPLYATGISSGRSFLGNVIAAGPETSFRFHTSAPPHKILVDPQMTLLCTTE
ncbi:MAG TPA: M1 family aminopeptidase [Candidatus Acidoferrum sp.]|nr:M1 family aminopeptidase [Candidatus Acidoferrum sp.]